MQEELELRNAAKKVKHSQAIEGKGKGIAVYNSSSSSSSNTDDQRNGDSAMESSPLINDSSENIQEQKNLINEDECADIIGEHLSDNDLREENDRKMKVPKGKSLDLKLYFWWRKEVQALLLANTSREAFLDCVGNA